MKRKYWTEEDVQILKENYKTKGNKWCQKVLERSSCSINSKAEELGLPYSKKVLFNKQELKKAVENSYCMNDLIDNLGKTRCGATHRMLKHYIEKYEIDTSHFDPYKKSRERLKAGKVRISRPLSFYLKKGSNISSTQLKNKLYKAGLKKRACEMEGCGQGEIWMGKKISLILDHINGDSKDNRLENLRIVCPNCNASLPTHCRGYKKKKV